MGNLLRRDIHSWKSIFQAKRANSFTLTDAPTMAGIGTVPAVLRANRDNMILILE
jgi:hypothetical protein